MTNVIAVVWSSEALHHVRMHRATFAAVCPDGVDAFERWWAGEPPEPGVTSSLILLDPAPASPRHRTWTPLEEATRPRYRGYADAASAISRGASSRS